MASLQIIDNNDALHLAWLEEFKQYASVPDDGRDALLASLLKTAILRVQEYADRALVKCRVRQTGRSDEKTGQFRLYLGGGDNLSVTYDYGGEEAAYVRNTADLLAVSPRGAVVTAEFDTVPLPEWKLQAKATVFRLGTALYDGETPEVCNSILNEVL